MSFMRKALIFVWLVVALTACGKQRVATQPDMPALAPPPPPPRVVTPPETAEEPPPTPPEPDRNKPPRRTPARSEPPRETPVKPEAAPKSPPAATPPAREETQPPPTTLQTVTPANQAQMERDARALLAQAKKDLATLRPASLNADGRGQYETARRFVEQADQALKEQNFVLAKQLADKAATIAAV